MAQCRSCKRQIVWLKTKAGKHMPVDYSAAAEDAARDNVVFVPGGDIVSHFETCPHAEAHRTARQARK